MTLELYILYFLILLSIEYYIKQKSLDKKSKLTHKAENKPF